MRTETNQIFKILIIGPQGSGKGTQAQLLAKKLSIPYFATGNILRQRLHTQDELAKQLESYMNQGILVPDKLMNKIAKEKVTAPESQAGYILDGYPRNKSQAKFLSKVDKLTHIIKVNISDSESLRRSLGRRTCDNCQTVYHLEYNPPKQFGVCDKCGGKLIVREDEDEQTLKQRLSAYHRFTEPMLKYYQEQGILFEINGEQPIKKVHQCILHELGID